MQKKKQIAHCKLDFEENTYRIIKIKKNEVTADSPVTRVPTTLILPITISHNAERI